MSKSSEDEPAGEPQETVRWSSDDKNGMVQVVEKTSGFSWTVLVRIAIAILTIGLGLFILYDRVWRTASLEGVILAPVLEIRAPIDGELTACRVRIGEIVEEGTRLFELENQSYDFGVTDTLRGEITRTSGSLASVNQQLNGINGMLNDLNKRLKDHLEANTERLEQSIAETLAAIEGARAEQAQAKLEQERANELTQAGSSSQQEGEQATLALAKAEAEELRLNAVLARLKAEKEASLNGILLGEGYSGAPYTQQRRDEVQLNLIQLTRERDSLKSELQALETRLTAELSHDQKMAQRTVNAPTSGLIAEVDVAIRSKVMQGDALARLVSIEKLYVEAVLPEKQRNNIAPGMKAEIRVMGSNQTLQGYVTSIRGGALSAEDFGFNDLLRRAGPETVVVNVRIDPESLQKAAKPPEAGSRVRVVF